MKYVDAHSHWADIRMDQSDKGLEICIRQCAEKGIDFFLQGGVNPEEWARQIHIQKKYPENFGLCFGLHPYFVSDHTVEDCELALDQLTSLLPLAMALGEAGLDFRPHIMKESELLQIEMFENQIELAKAFQKPMVLHIVQAHDKAIQIFNLWDVPERLGLVHAFSGSYDTAKKYIDKGFLISVGGAVTLEKNSKLQDCIKKIPMEYLLIESDSPDQPPEGWSGPNNSTSIYKVAEKIGLIRNISVFDVLEVNTSNFKRLFRL
jgi:TatD DNase family protein